MYLVAAGRRVSFAERIKAVFPKAIAIENEYKTPVSQILNTLVIQDDERLLEILSCDVNFLCFNDRLCAKLSHLPNYIGPNSIVSNLCYDKKKFEEYFKNSELSSIYPWPTNGGINIKKPRFGNSSKGIEIGRNFIQGPDTVLQRFIKGTEYSVDCYFDQGFPCFIVPRTRDRIAGGEVIESTTVNHSRLINYAKAIGKSLQYNGPACMQFIDDESECYIIEVNARFGGGSILTLETLGPAVIQCLQNRSRMLIFSDIKWGKTMKRVNREFFF